jgi:hypothetical protein
MLVDHFDVRKAVEVHYTPSGHHFHLVTNTPSRNSQGVGPWAVSVAKADESLTSISSSW